MWRIFYKMMSVPHDIVMHVNNIMSTLIRAIKSPLQIGCLFCPCKISWVKIKIRQTFLICLFGNHNQTFVSVQFCYCSNTYSNYCGMSINQREQHNHTYQCTRASTSGTPNPPPQKKIKNKSAHMLTTIHV